MKKKTKAFRIGLAVAAAALLAGGIYLLFKDDFQQKVDWNKIKDYAPTPIVCEALDNAVQVNENSDIPQKIVNEMTSQVQDFGQIYSNSVGWIYVPNTNINYPIMQSDNNNFYLHRAADGSYLYAGSIFLDYRCNADFSGISSIIYGHNMGNGSMFADVTNFTDRTYFDSHRYGWLTTENDLFCVQFFAVDQTENTSEIYNTNADWQADMSEVVNHAVLYDDIEISDTDRLLMLSTCTGADSDSRTILVGKIMEDYV